MKKIALAGLLFFSVLSMTAQSFIGYLTDNYSGVNSVVSNPANIVDSRYRFDINLAGASILAGNDYYSVNIFDAIKSDYDFDSAEKTAKDKNNVFGNVDILGPSVMFNIDEKNSLAVFTRGRVFYNINDVNGETIENVGDEFELNENLEISEGDFNLGANAWAEVGVSYARVLFDNDVHFLKGGISLKYLQGLGNAYATGNNVEVNFDADGAGTTGTIETTGQVAYGYSANVEDDFEDFEAVSGATGFGADLGFVYEYRPNYKDYMLKYPDGTPYLAKYENKYKYKFSLSITDFGSINYGDAVQETYSINNTVNQDSFNSIDDLQDKLETLYTLDATGDATKAMLPTAVHLNADWNINQKFYLNLNADVSITSRNKANTNSFTNVISITPRFERKWVSIYAPISYVERSGIQVGTGLRAGPLYIGSGSILSILVSENTDAADFYMGLKIPFFHNKSKDKDGDGILNKYDDCPGIKGPVENNGCPWDDRDNDKILDKDDKCPEISGPVENNGCPWPDTDDDSVLDKDDGCPEIPGPVENTGCPWPDTDNDGIPDKDDECIDIAGTVANNGCPEVTQVIQDTLNEYAKTILFNTGKDEIKEESFIVLTDIIKILQQYPSAKFSIEGHTDSDGSDINNMRLSDSRANSVKKYLIENGIDQFRLSAVGFGEDRPVASNKTKDGKARNRRVEINLVKE